MNSNIPVFVFYVVFEFYVMIALFYSVRNYGLGKHTYLGYQKFREYQNWLLTLCPLWIANEWVTSNLLSLTNYILRVCWYAVLDSTMNSIFPLSFLFNTVGLLSNMLSKLWKCTPCFGDFDWWSSDLCLMHLKLPIFLISGKNNVQWSLWSCVGISFHWGIYFILIGVANPCMFLMKL